MIVELNHKIMPDGKRYSEFVCDFGGAQEFVTPEDVCVGSKLTIIDHLNEDNNPYTLYYSPWIGEFVYGGQTLTSLIDSLNEPQE